MGIGNVWRFPYLAYDNGGGAFLFPYVILLILVGKPMYYMETAMGQFSRTSPLQLWRCAPIAIGVGFAMIILSVIVSIYYNVIMAYSIIYIGASFVGTYEELPWAYCGKILEISTNLPRPSEKFKFTSSQSEKNESRLRGYVLYMFRAAPVLALMTSSGQDWERSFSLILMSLPALLYCFLVISTSGLKTARSTP